MCIWKDWNGLLSFAGDNNIVEKTEEIEKQEGEQGNGIVY